MDRTEMRRFPNSTGAKAVRRAELRAARTVEHRTRAEVMVEACRGKRVLDLGCVGHSAEAMNWPQWLHDQIAQAGAFCVGVDYETESVRLMRAAGLVAFPGDIDEPPTSELVGLAPFDLVVAGELIEHLA